MCICGARVTGRLWWTVPRPFGPPHLGRFCSSRCSNRPAAAQHNQLCCRCIVYKCVSEWHTKSILFHSFFKRCAQLNRIPRLALFTCVQLMLGVYTSNMSDTRALHIGRCSEVLLLIIYLHMPPTAAASSLCPLRAQVFEHTALMFR